MLFRSIDLTDLARLPTTASVGWRGGRLTGGATAGLRYVVPLFAGLDPDTAGLTGICDVRLALTGPAMPQDGEGWIAWFDRWRGDGEVGLRDAGFAPAKQLQGLLAPLGPLSQGAAPIGKDGRLAIDAFSAPFTFAEGFVRTTAGEWLAAGRKIGLSGSVALDGSLDYGLDLTALLQGRKDGDRVLQALGGKLPPARLKGTLDAPALALPELGNVAQKLLEQQGKDLLKKGLEDLIKKDRK